MMLCFCINQSGALQSRLAPDQTVGHTAMPVGPVHHEGSLSRVQQSRSNEIIVSPMGMSQFEPNSGDAGRFAPVSTQNSLLRGNFALLRLPRPFQSKTPKRRSNRAWSRRYPGKFAPDARRDLLPRCCLRATARRLRASRVRQ